MVHKFLANIDLFLLKMELSAKERNAPVFRKTKIKWEPFNYLIFTVLSSRTRDEKTIEICNKLFSRFKNAEQLSKADIRSIENLIRSVGFYKVKARRIKTIAKIILERYNGNVPDKFEELIKLPGVGRKTANVVLANVYRKARIGVDTHVHRISNRIGIVKTKNKNETEKELMKIIPEKYRARFNRIFVGFGQTICLPKKPNCKVCPLKGICSYYLSSSRF